MERSKGFILIILLGGKIAASSLAGNYKICVGRLLKEKPETCKKLNNKLCWDILKTALFMENFKFSFFNFMYIYLGAIFMLQSVLFSCWAIRFFIQKYVNLSDRSSWKDILIRQRASFTSLCNDQGNWL